METVYDYNAQQTVCIYYSKYTMGPWSSARKT